MTITQYNSLTPEFKWASFEKNLDELINITTIGQRKIYDPNFVLEHQDKHNPESAPKFTSDPRSTVFSIYANPFDLPQKSTIHASIRKPIHPLVYRYLLFSRSVWFALY